MSELRWIALLLLVFFMLTAPVLADSSNRLKTIELGNESVNNLGSYLSVISDPNDDLSPFEIITDQWDSNWQAVAQQDLNLGLTNHTYWLRLSVDASASVHKHWDLVISEPTLDYIDIYQIFEGLGPRLIYRSGMKRTFDNRYTDHRFYIVPLEVFNSPNTPIEFLLRVQSKTSLYVPMQLYPVGDFWSYLQQADIINWMFYGGILAMVLYNLFLYTVVKDISYLFYVLFISSFAVLHLSLDGYVFQHLWPEERAYSYAVDGMLLSTSSAFGLLFITNFLNLKNELPMLNKIVIGMVFFNIFVFCVTFYYSEISFFSFYLLIALTTLITGLWVGIQASRMNVLVAKYFTLGWLVFTVGNAYFLFVKMGYNLLPIPPILVSKVATFAETMLLSFALARRIRVLTDEREKQTLKAQAQSYFLAQVSHEIRTPLNGVIGTVELLDQTSLNEEQSYYLKTLKSSGRSLLMLVNDVLDYTKIEAGKMTIRNEAVNIYKLIEDQVDLFRYQAEQKGVAITVNWSAAVPEWIESDAQRLRQVWLNLISNAVKFTDEGSVSVLLSVVESDKQLFLSTEVKDTGIGIPKKDLTRLFTAYQQVNSGNRKIYGGTGLGLAISNELVIMLGGTLSVNSILGRGSEFCALVPLVATNEPDLFDTDYITEHPARGLNILVAEDNLVNQRVITGLLEKLNHNVFLATNGEEAYAQVAMRAQRFDLIFMDCEMPILDGYDATHKIRQYEKEQLLEATPIIAITAHALEDVRKKCFDAGMNEFLTKPINKSLLLKTIQTFSQIKKIRQ